MHGFFCACSFILVYFLYPETKGVSLEEMDAVFGEEEFEERMEDEESERASLISNMLPTSRQRAPDAEGSWFSHLFNLGRKYTGYEAIEQR